jgi:broad specificity phosphatase PhoE
MTRIYLVRHGENRANITKEFSYRKVDYPLTEKGRLQAEQTAVYFRDKEIHAIYSSPLRRAKETADAIAEAVGAPVVIRENFREVNVGILEDQGPTPEAWTLHDAIMDEWRAGRVEVTFPGGENYVTLCERMYTGLLEIAQNHPGQNIVVVAHGGIIGAGVRDICANVDLEELNQVPNRNCAVTEMTLALEDDRIASELIRWAACDHIDGAAANFVPASPAEEAAQVGGDGSPGRTEED